MTFIRHLLLTGLIVYVLLCCGCATIDINEKQFLRDKQQSILYALVRHGASNAENLADRTHYEEESINRTLERLQDEGVAELLDGKWRISEHYREQEKNYVDAIERFSIDKVQRLLPAHETTFFDVPNSTIKGAAFVTAGATESMLVFPGNGFTLVPDINEVAKLVSANRNVFVLEYPGMGDSDGELTVETLTQAAERFAAHISGLDEVSNTRIVLYGFSLGGFVATHVSTLMSVDALILDSTAPDMQRWVDTNVPAYAKAFVDVKVDAKLSRVSNITPIENAKYPMLFIAGGKDKITPPALVKEIFNAAQKSSFKRFEVLAEIDHGGSVDDPKFSVLVNDFLSKVDKP